MRKAILVAAAFLLVACAKEDPSDPAIQREKLRHSLEVVDKNIASYKERGFDSVDDLKKIKSKLEEELKELDE
jgi:hypothetical protein